MNERDFWHDGPFGWNPHALILVIACTAPAACLFAALTWLWIT